MNFIMDMDEQIFRLSEGAMGFHCNWGKVGNMPFRFFKKNIELNLNSFLLDVSISNNYHECTFQGTFLRGCLYVECLCNAAAIPSWEVYGEAGGHVYGLHTRSGG